MSPAESKYKENIPKNIHENQEVNPPKLQQQESSNSKRIMVNTSMIVEAQITTGINTTGGEGVLQNALNIQRDLELQKIF